MERLERLAPWCEQEWPWPLQHGALRKKGWQPTDDTHVLVGKIEPDSLSLSLSCTYHKGRRHLIQSLEDSLRRMAGIAAYTNSGRDTKAPALARRFGGLGARRDGGTCARTGKVVGIVFVRGATTLSILALASGGGGISSTEGLAAWDGHWRAKVVGVSYTSNTATRVRLGALKVSVGIRWRVIKMRSCSGRERGADRASSTRSESSRGRCAVAARAWRLLVQERAHDIDRSSHLATTSHRADGRHQACLRSNKGFGRCSRRGSGSSSRSSSRSSSSRSLDTLEQRGLNSLELGLRDATRRVFDQLGDIINANNLSRQTERQRERERGQRERARR